MIQSDTVELRWYFSVIRALYKQPEKFDSVVCVTAQHGQMLDRDPYPLPRAPDPQCAGPPVHRLLGGMSNVTLMPSPGSYSA